MLSLDDTICALATPAGGAARCVVRLSGPGTLDCLASVFEPAPSPGGRARSAAGIVRLPEIHSPLPATLWLWPTERSYTRQPAGELHTLGSQPLAEAVVERLCRCGARLARPGEFTLRAFLAGRLDLTQAEAVLGVIEAREPGELQAALAQLAGGVGGPLAEIRRDLLDLLADLEAGLDFADEDLPFLAREELLGRLGEAHAALQGQLALLASRRGEELPRVVLAGPTNAGKSRLFNALTGAAAVVSPQAGATRDYLAARLELDGVACLLTDTAGWTAASGEIESTAQRMAAEQRSGADLVVLCADATAPGGWPEAASERELRIWTKCDLLSGAPPPGGELATSAATGAGLGELRSLLARRLAEREGRAATLSAVRCRQAIESASSAITEGLRLAESGGSEEWIAGEVRLALSALGEVVGAVYTEDLLDRVFSRFCIGK